jgi:hypothetical protein
MAADGSPRAWFWSHDIEPDQIDSIATPGTRLARLSSYRSGDRRRFAALVYLDAGPQRSYALDLDAEALRSVTGRPVAITVDERGPARFTVVLEPEPGPAAEVHPDLDEGGVRALLDGSRRIVDLATYADSEVRRYAVVVADGAAGSSFITGVTADELDDRLRGTGVEIRRLRAYREGGRSLLAAIAEPSRRAGRAWYSELDADGVARELERNDAYPVDLDATRDERGTRFTVVMSRQD